MSKKAKVGGQAVIEGVMMRGEKGIATAVRKADGKIEIKLEPIFPITKKNKITALPFIRGFLNLIDSLIVGVKSLNYSSSFFEDDEEDGEPSKFEQWFYKVFKDKAGDIVVGISMLLGVALAMLLFMVVPTAITGLIKKMNVDSSFILSFIEGIMSLVIFLLYLFAISKMEDIYRVFQYHGAEHKTIYCYENQLELTPENADKFGTLHPRCGTNFMFLVMAVSIFLFSFLNWGSILERMFFKLLLLPVVSGITYELIRWLGNTKSKLGHVIAYPGMMLQKLTTKQPDLEMLEVAIVSLQVAEGIKTVEEIKNMQRDKSDEKAEEGTKLEQSVSEQEAGLSDKEVVEENNFSVE
ncbi:DUF1385 domain-containing protein [Clostridium cellulovorans]|uniref:Metal-dependent enzyme n=1 Tax=Clostridium cellulovorans (strain ATCC 35296 / DSM 3052 / OCM 3 / 743B) TaxID=573061 RepID=D9STM5_CLOC7|nr:DUF1385 domain-containing protein [Clostridium cellulovorans]ADL52759.1 protein of unknown function DUF1385 [Clostridium cellulovorans 743B]